MQRSTLFLLCSALLWACSDPSEKADTIYHNGRIWTGQQDTPWAGSVAIRGERIIYIGDDHTKYKSTATVMQDLEGKLVVPGFIDNHTHFLMGGHDLASVDLRAAKTKADFIRILKEYATSVSKGRWILGGNWDHENWGGELPEKEWVDSVTREHPVFVTRYDGHMAFANSKALQLAGIDLKSRSPAGGLIVKNKKGEPAGVFKDEAMGLINAAIPPFNEKEMDEFFERAQTHALENGITQVHDMGMYGGWTELATYRRNKEKGKLKMRIYSFVPLSNWKKLDSFCRADGKGDDMLRWGGLKGFVDGSLGSTTAWFYEPYLDEPDSKGFPVTDTALLREWVNGAHRAGLHVAVHAIGDRANDFILDVFHQVNQLDRNSDNRFRIEHAQHLSVAALEKISYENVIPSMQPYHAIDDGRWAYKRLDSARLKRTYAFKTLLAKGARLTFGSDWTVAPLDPIEGIHAAVTRSTLDGKHPQGWYPEEKITVTEALRSYTYHNAFAGYQEDRLGVLKKGMLADLVVLSDDIFKIDPVELKKIRVERTIINGKEVYTRASGNTK